MYGMSSTAEVQKMPKNHWFFAASDKQRSENKQHSTTHNFLPTTHSLYPQPADTTLSSTVRFEIIILYQTMSIFQQLNDFVVETSDQIMKVVAEGTSVILQTDDLSSTRTTNKDNNIHDHNNEDAGDYGDLNIGMDMDIDPAEKFESPLNSIADGVLNDILQKQMKPQSTWENIQAFKSAITWGEPFILSLIAMHILILFGMMYSVKRGGITSQFGILISIFAIVRMAERLNNLGAEHWETIATQDYFDSQGVFVSLMVCLPLMIIAVVMLLSLLRESAGLLVTVKRNELKAKAKARAGKTTKNGAAGKNIKNGKDKQS